MKVHLRLVRVGAHVLRVVTLRASCTARFSTNLFHNTWHVLTDHPGAFVLARLMWGLAFQRKPGTIVVIDGAHLVPTPFESDRADPIVLVNTDITRVDARVLRALRASRPNAGTTIRFHTFGLARPDDTPSWSRRADPDDSVERAGGFICYAGPPHALRSNARMVYAMRATASMGYHFLGTSRRFNHAPGEVQVFADFHDMVSAARVARRTLAKGGPLRTASERESIYRETEKRTLALRDRRLNAPNSR